ncbi:unnamed protein product [Caenorhabditis auriculariae]|uniref:Uncharacterized protein n=1 Tax=Caenorhabditis auriculariae TaxID=2777116 RepID=A0A8S1HSV9_9PELO|nr:unnamed protein product [Caenorhabditis auriculariae]
MSSSRSDESFLQAERVRRKNLNKRENDFRSQKEGIDELRQQLQRDEENQNEKMKQKIATQQERIFQLEGIYKYQLLDLYSMKETLKTVIEKEERNRIPEEFIAPRNIELEREILALVAAQEEEDRKRRKTKAEFKRQKEDVLAPVAAHEKEDWKRSEPKVEFNIEKESPAVLPAQEEEDSKRSEPIFVDEILALFGAHEKEYKKRSDPSIELKRQKEIMAMAAAQEEEDRKRLELEVELERQKEIMAMAAAQKEEDKKRLEPKVELEPVGRPQEQRIAEEGPRFRLDIYHLLLFCALLVVVIAGLFLFITTGAFAAFRYEPRLLTCYGANNCTLEAPDAKNPVNSDGFKCRKEPVEQRHPKMTSSERLACPLKCPATNEIHVRLSTRSLNPYCLVSLLKREEVVEKRDGNAVERRSEYFYQGANRE